MNRALPFLAFFLSGASSLVFQTIWSRLLHHVFGSSSVAISSVVSAFMGGLALGAFVFGRYADRIRRPLRVYALAEVGVGLCGLLVPLLIGADGPLADVNAMLRQRLDPGSSTFMVARFVCIVPVLIVPTTLMGATLPLLARYYVARNATRTDASVRIGSLYAVNTLGAVSGVFMAGFVLMPQVGVATTNVLAVCTNFALAAVLLWMLREGPELRPRDSSAGATAGTAGEVGPTGAGPQPGSESESESESAGAQAMPPRVRVTAAVVFGLSGLASLLYEVVWSRALINTIGGSVYAFSLILMTFLIGIAGGSAVASAIERRARLLGATALFSLCLAILGLVPAGVRHGSGAFLVGLLLAGLAVGAVFATSRRERRTRASLLDAASAASAAGDDARHALRLAAIPVAVVALVALLAPGRLAYICGSVVALDALLLAILLLLRTRPIWLLAALQAFIALASFTSDLWADSLSLTFAGAVAPLYDALLDSVDVVLGLMLLVAALCVLPAALAMGAMFPATMRVWAAGGKHVGRDVGVVYTGNTVGSIIGAWLPGFILMPAFGMQGTLHIGIALNLALAGLLAWAASETTRARLLAVAGSVPLWLAAVAGLYLASVHADGPLAWNLSRMTLGAFRISLAKDVLDEEAWGAPELVYYRDGLSTTVTVERWGRHYSLKNNGKVDASNGDDMPTQIVVSAFPLLMHQRGPRALDVAIVGFGSGVTVGAALQFPVRSIDVVELEDGVMEASRFFADVNHLDYVHEGFPYVEMPRLRLYADDGRNFLAAAQRQYDVIISEPSNPWLTGVSDLFTVDHFRISKRRLKPEGVYCQWVQLYEMSPRNVKLIYRTFASQFRHVVVFSAEDLSSDTVLVGSDSPLTFDLARANLSFADPRVAAELERAYLHAPQDVFARVLLASKDEVLSYAGPGPLNTDDNALIEFAAPRDLIGFERYKGYLSTFYSAAWPHGGLDGHVTGFGEGAVGANDRATQALSLLAHGRKAQAAVFVAAARAQAGTPEVELAAAVLEGLVAKAGALEPDLGVPALPAELSERMVRRVHDAYAEVVRFRGRGEPVAAFRAFDRLPGPVRAAVGPPAVFLHAWLAAEAGHEEVAIEALEQLARNRPVFILTHPQLYYVLGRAHDARSHFDKAVRNMRVYVEALRARLLPETQPARNRPPGSTDAPGQCDKSYVDADCASAAGHAVAPASAVN